MKSLLRYFAVTWQVRTGREIAYMLVGLPLAVVWFVYVVAMYAVGIALVILWVGLVVLVAVQMTLRPIGAAERTLVNTLLGSEIARPLPRSEVDAPGAEANSRLTRWGRRLVNDSHSWRVLTWVLGRIVIAPVGFVVAIIGAVVPLGIIASLVVSVVFQLGLPAPLNLDDDSQAAHVMGIVTFWVLVASPALIALIPAFPWMVRGYATLTVMFARWALGPSADEALARATERAELAETQVRIDQELHDSIGHMITMNVVQAGAGAHVFDTDPEFARQALRNIEERGRMAMGELDRIIATIRGDDDELRAPLPMLKDLPALMDQFVAAGIKVESRLEAGHAPDTLSRAAYAIVREAVTNAAKHSPGAPLHVHTTMLPDALAICVRNGPPPRERASIPDVHGQRLGSGHGLAGIRDRTALLGGVSRVGRTPDGGYEVMVLLALEIGLDPHLGDEADSQCCKWSRARGTVSA